MDDIEAIKQLKARYFRTMDTKDWAGMRLVFTDDVVVDTTASGGPMITGADEFIAFLKNTLADNLTVHTGTMPEIKLTSDTTATGIWAMQDIVHIDNTVLHGWGHYHETYRKTDGDWRIATTTLTRLHTEFTLSGKRHD